MEYTSGRHGRVAGSCLLAWKLTGGYAPKSRIRLPSLTCQPEHTERKLRFTPRRRLRMEKRDCVIDEHAAHVRNAMWYRRAISSFGTMKV